MVPPSKRGTLPILPAARCGYLPSPAAIGRLGSSPCTTPSATSHQESRRWRSPASGRCRTCPRRTTGSGATWSPTSGSRSGFAGFEWPTSPAARATAPTSWRGRPPRWSASTRTRRLTSTPGCATGAQTCASSGGWWRSFGGRATRSRSSRRSSTSPSPSASWSGLPPPRRSPTSRRRTGSRSRRPGAQKSDNPWHLREYTLAEYRALLEPRFSRVEMLGVFHAGKLRIHELALRLGWDRVHPTLRLTRPFYERFVPAISSSDFKVTAEGDLERRARLPGRLPCLSALGRPRPGPALAHALRRGLRDLPVRRGVAVRRGGPLVPSRPRAGPRPDGHRDPGARRPARGARRREAAGGVPAPPPARGGRARGAPGRLESCVPRRRRRPSATGAP